MEIIGKIGANLITNNMSSVIIIIILLCMIRSFLQGWKGIQKIKIVNKEIDLLKNKLNSYKEEFSIEERKKISKQELYDKLAPFEEFGNLKNNLTDYLKNEFLSVEKCFNEISILEKHFNITDIQSKGQTLIGLGVLGTFIGLIISLKGINTENAENISQVLNGINTAFITSILGMVFSLFYNSMYKQGYGETSKNIASIVYELEVILPTPTPTLILQEVKFSLDTFIKNIGSNLNVQIEKEAKDIFSKYQGGFDRAIQNVGTSVSKELGKVFDTLFIEKFQAIKDNFIETLELTTEELNESRELLKNLGKTLPNLLKGLKEIENSSEKIKLYSQETNKNYEQFIERSPEKEAEFLSIVNFQNKLKDTVEIINGALVTNSKEVIAISEILKEQIVDISKENQSVKKLSEENRNSLETYSKRINALQEDFLEITKLSYEKYLSMTKEGQFDFAKGVEKALVEYDSIATEILSKILKVKKNELDMNSK